jgi:hypothetical protein
MKKSSDAVKGEKGKPLDFVLIGYDAIRSRRLWLVQFGKYERASERHRR